MHLKSLYLKNFRNYAECEIHFSPQLNVFYGDNAQGKTNLLEAIYLVATGRSFRSEHLSDLIREGSPFFYLEAVIIRDNVSQLVKISYDGKVKRLQINGNAYASFHPLLGLLPSVLYTPCDIELISGAPAQRRRFLNFHLAQSDPLYVHHLSRYTRAMKQRNCLLRAKAKETLDCWEAEMAHSASFILEARQKMVDELQGPLLLEGQKLAGSLEAHELHFRPSQEKFYLAQLQKNRMREMELGLTLSGPHRDDLLLTIERKPAQLFASEGQKKTFIAALRLAEWARLSEQIGAPALMSIDDLGSHLDETRQTLLQNALKSLGQVFISTPHSPSSKEGLEKGRAIHISQGALGAIT